MADFQNEHAYIPREKLTAYLLSEQHPVGRYKARFFASLGFTAENAEVLAKALLALAEQGSTVAETVTPYGTKYTIDGTLTSSTGRAARVRTVWIREASDAKLRLVTAYPN